jgi:hypothetical protein
MTGMHPDDGIDEHDDELDPDDEYDPEEAAKAPTTMGSSLRSWP